MTILDTPHRWRFARACVEFSDCATAILKLRKLFETRTQQPLDELFGYSCRSLDAESSVYFHRVDRQRAMHCDVVVVHRIPAEDASTLRACAQIGRKHGYYEFIDWQAEGIHGQWRKREQEGQAASIAWEQWPVSGVAFDCLLWDALWQSAAKDLGIESLLLKQTRGDYAIPVLRSEQPFRQVDLGEAGASQVVDDFDGAVVVIRHERANKVGMRVANIDDTRARAIWASGVRTMTGALGAAIGQTFNISYDGNDVSVTESLNAVLPICHSVDYVARTPAVEYPFANIYKPMRMNEGQLSVFPALSVEFDDDLEADPVLQVNVVRRSSDCWLEFQLLDSLPIHSWLGEVLGAEIEIWNGPAENRWGW